MARTEYYDDPKAPEPNSLVVAASAVVADEQGRILLQRRRDNDLWALPGGGMDLTDSLPGTAVREVKEETGLEVQITGLVGTYTDPKHIIAYTDGEVRRQFNVCFTARITGGHLEISASCRPRRSRTCRCTTPSACGSATIWRAGRRPISADPRG
jgi:8-oxo-dGTP pyrophosphatase MutT (NUDIX family)